MRLRLLAKGCPALVAAVTAAQILAACSPAPRRFTGVSGLVAPCGTSLSPARMRVIVKGRSGQVVRSQIVRVYSPAARYRISLRPGSYWVSAPLADLPPVLFQARAGRDTVVNLWPSCK
jgi:hypothetical protein